MSLSQWVDRAIRRAGHEPASESWQWALMLALIDSRCKQSHYLHPRDALGRAPDAELEAIETRAARIYAEAMTP